jgi:two-component system chemotaxis sensor kinase CheA
MTPAETFRDEASDLLSDLEIALIDLESRPEDRATVSRVFRNLHTIKGSGGMLGFDKLAAFIHELESAYDLVRGGKLSVTPSLISHTLLARDHIKQLLDGVEGPDIEAAGQRLVNWFLEIQKDLNAAVQKTVPGTNKQSGRQTVASAAENVPVTYRIKFKPPAESITRGINVLRLLQEIKDLGDLSVTCHTETLPELDELQLETCYLSWDLQLTTSQGIDSIHGVFLFVEEGSALEITVLEDQKPEVGVSKEAAATVATEISAPPTPAKRPARAEASSLRVSATKLDDLVNIVGEIVTMQARLTQVAGSYGDPEMTFVAEEMERLIDKLRDNTMSIRMLPIGATFGNFRRLVRDLARDLGKQVELIEEGGETELDKTVIDQINDPMVHLIRNCVDHGIESPAARTAAGKSPTGRIVLSAVHSGAHVLIEIKDDGGGLDKDAIRKKGIERGLIKPGQELSEEEIFGLILNPGFSTAKTISGVSGRGVGMDVVKQNVEALGGTLEISSKAGAGSTFRLKLPLTLAIIDGLLVRVGDQYFVLPLANILECFELSMEAIRENYDRKFVVVREEMVPYVDIREHFEIQKTRPEISQVMIAETREGKFGFLVDNVIGDHKTVIKRLGGLYKDVESISGATILGDGTIALILDLDKLARCAVIEHTDRLLTAV